MPRIDITTAPERAGHSYPEPFRSGVGLKHRRQLGEAAGLTQFGVNLDDTARLSGRSGSPLFPLNR